MPRRWPPLELRELLAILTALGFTYTHSKGGHDFYKAHRKGRTYRVTVDPKHAPFDNHLLKFMCDQAGCTRDEFYNATPAAAAKIADGKRNK